jgi:3-phosphoshikimate 1-carboxyvinyltransferase
VVPPQRLRATEVEIEGDHSSASYLFAAAAILGGRVAIRGLRVDSAQPDARFPRDLVSLGCRVDSGRDAIVVAGSGRFPPFAWDLADAPDLAPTAAVLALFAEGACALSGLQHLNLKESDRLAVLQNLARLGARAPWRLHASIFPPTRERFVGDDPRRWHHRTRCIPVAGLAVPGVIDDPSVVAKSYPRFWNDSPRSSELEAEAEVDRRHDEVLTKRAVVQARSATTSRDRKLGGVAGCRGSP